MFGCPPNRGNFTYERWTSRWHGGLEEYWADSFTKGTAGSIGVVAMLEGVDVDDGVEVVEAGWQAVDGKEL
jgi:hypothetical protein